GTMLTFQSHQVQPSLFRTLKSAFGEITQELVVHWTGFVKTEESTAKNNSMIQLIRSFRQVNQFAFWTDCLGKESVMEIVPPIMEELAKLDHLRKLDLNLIRSQVCTGKQDVCEFDEWFEKLTRFSFGMIYYLDMLEYA